jgi:periplasmic protein CpxP/Spy
MTIENQTPESSPARRRPGRGRRILIGALLFALGGAGGFALGAHAPAAVFRHGMHLMKTDPQALAARVEHRIDRALSRIDANAEQKAKIEAAAKSAVLDLAKLGIDPRETHEKFIDLLRADKIDPEALETLRAAQAGKWDAASKRIVQAIEEAAPVLTAEQRRHLTERWLRRDGK